ncbi:MAG: UbiX family flavin prenyltransferase [Methanomassiliicoccales archaeon]|nr:UbiX family flavin prenyltransferase [Methanomassiliicoccales archaeon]
MKTVIAITGASGAIYGKRLLETLSGEKTLIISDTAREIIKFELGIDAEDLERLADFFYRNDDLFAPISSGSQFFDAMVIAPCSEGTIAKIAAGIADSLITRVAAVAMKEGRTLVLVPRETPLSAVMLENQLKLCKLGVKILPACPAFYHNPRTVDDLVDFVVGKVLDQIGETHNLFRRWRA